MSQKEFDQIGGVSAVTKSSDEFISSSIKNLRSEIYGLVDEILDIKEEDILKPPRVPFLNPEFKDASRHAGSNSLNPDNSKTGLAIFYSRLKKKSV